MSEILLFVGPTAYGLPPRLFEDRQIARRPPVQRGDIERTINGIQPGTLVIVDGRFGDVMAVGHRELLSALDRGWRVWGVASMGAVRAAELATEGMSGYGAVYNHFAGSKVPDDEVAVLHAPGPTYRPLTEALVDLRQALVHLVAAEAMAEAAAHRVDHALANIWFGDRSLITFTALCEDIAGSACMQAVRAVARRMADHRAKTADLRAFLEEAPWIS